MMNATVPIQVNKLYLASPGALRPVLLDAGTGVTLESGYKAALTQQQSDAPILTTQPLTPGTYKGTDGKSYVVPSARIGLRANMPRTPDVTFKSDGQNWKLIMTLELLLPPNSEASATVLLLDNYLVRILSGDQSKSYDFPLVTPMQPVRRADNVVGVLQAEGIIDETFGLTLLREKPDAHLYVTGRLTYRHNVTIRQTDPQPSRSTADDLPYRRIQMSENLHPGAAVYNAALFRPNLDQPPISGRPATFITKTMDATIDAVLTSTERASFPSDLHDFKPIYAAILGQGIGDVSVWSQETGQGYSRPSPNGNEYYVLPDSFRLALDPTTGVPSMNVILVTTPPAVAGGSATYSVRLRFAIVPLLDGARLERMRAALRGAQNILYAALTIGGYSSAKLKPSALFASLPGFQSSMVGTPADAQQVDAGSGFELVWDCSLEFYTLLTKLLSSSDGVQGSVEFQLATARTDSTPPVETTNMVSVPLVLSLLGPFAVQPLTKLDQTKPANPNAISISITNPLAVPLAIDGIFPTLLDSDWQLQLTSSATPLVASDAALKLDPKASYSTIAGSPTGTALPAYTTLAATYGTVTPSFNPPAVLAHYHELAATTGVEATAHFECYLLKHPDKIPTSLSGLIGMQVEIQCGQGPVVELPLTLDTPVSDIQIPYSFDDLLAGLSLSEPTFKYRAKTIFPDHTGPFCDWLLNTGRNVLVTPV